MFKSSGVNSIFKFGVWIRELLNFALKKPVNILRLMKA